MPEPKESTGRLREILSVLPYVFVLLGGGVVMLGLGISSLLEPGELTADEYKGTLLFTLMGLAFCGMGALMLVLAWKRYRWKCGTNPRAPEATGKPTGAHYVRNVPDALRGTQPPRGAVVVAGTPAWLSRVVILFVSALAATMLYVGWNIDTIFPEAPVWAGYPFVAMGALFLTFIGWRLPKDWGNREMSFLATREGVYIHGEQDPDAPGEPGWVTPNTRWLFVPWGNVTDVREGELTVAAITGGELRTVRFSLRVTPEEAHQWFPHCTAEPHADGRGQLVHYQVSAPIGNSPDKIVPRLQQLWARARP
ncbi:hypothetical protein [Arhodomonas sp. SL1]|uniref:hypothetical protein n=1 Tax=Arhodomonas sp. SL1 TaxID=3425691 RepID=UPI003F883E48